MPSYDKRLLERRQFSHLTLAYFPKCQFLKVQCVKLKRLYLYNKATKSYTLELDDRLLLESVNCMIFSVWFGVLNIQPARLTRFLYQLPKASWWILQQINIKDFNFPFPPVLRLIRESCRTSRLCAPASPDSSSRTCVPFLLLWWRTEPWSLLILWVSKHTASSHPFGFFFSHSSAPRTRFWIMNAKFRDFISFIAVITRQCSSEQSSFQVVGCILLPGAEWSIDTVFYLTYLFNSHSKTSTSGGQLELEYHGIFYESFSPSTTCI